MRRSKIIVAEFLSLDGVMESPRWAFPYWSEEIASFKQAELFACDGLLLGRKTYDRFAQAWPPRAGVDAYADRMNALPKYVVSTTLEKAEWHNSTLIKENIVDEVCRLKQQPGRNLLIFGSGQLIVYLMRYNLIDEYRLLVYPLVLGQGRRLFPEGSAFQLTLTRSRRFRCGVTGLIYSFLGNVFPR